MNYNNIDRVWEAIEAGHTICWSSDAYQLTIEPVNREWRKRQGFALPFSTKGEFCLRVTCMSNWFGSLLEESELSKLYVKNNTKVLDK